VPFTPFGLVNAAPPIRLPGDLGAVAWNMDPMAVAQSSISAAGTIYLMGIVLRQPATISSLGFGMTVIAVTPTANQNFLALVDANGVIQASTPAGQLDSQITTAAGWVWSNVTTPFAAPAGRYYVALLFNAVTPPVLLRGNSALGNTSQSDLGNAVAAQFWLAVNGTGQTALPGSFTLSSNTHTGSFAYCVAVK
jgi:hypothetical protein